MLTLLAFGLLHAQQPTVVSVERVRPSRVLNQLQQLLPSVKIEADDRNRNLTYYGAESGADEFRSFVKLLDVTPRNIRLRMEVDSPTDHYHGKTVTQIANVREWSMEDPYLGYAIRITGRINDDGTVTLVTGSKCAGHAQTITIRVKDGEPFWIRPGVMCYTDEQWKRIHQNVPLPGQNDYVVSEAEQLARFKESLATADRDLVPTLRIDVSALDLGQTWSEAPGFPKR